VTYEPEFQTHYPIQWDQFEAADNGQWLYLVKNMKVFKPSKNTPCLQDTAENNFFLTVPASIARTLMKEH